MNREECSIKLQQLIQDLASQETKLDDPTECQQYIDRFNNIYSVQNFRHLYSSFFPLLQEVDAEENSSLDYLSTNLAILHEKFDEKLKDIDDNKAQLTNISADDTEIRICMCFIKLFDHMNLEIARWRYYAKSNQAIENLNNDLQKTRNELAQAKNELEQANNKIKATQGESLTVFGIFSAIIITFFGGFNFITSSITSIHEIHIFKGILVILLCGFIIVNTVFLLFYFIGKLTDKSIFTPFPLEKNSERADKRKHIGSLRQIKRRLPYMFWFNVIILVLMLADIGIWFVWSEKYPSLFSVLSVL